MQSSFLLYGHTLKHLKWQQVLYRLWNRLPSSPPSTPQPIQRREAGPGRWVPPIQKPPTWSSPATFRFLNEERQWPSVPDWSVKEVPRLWQYHLHYFDFLMQAAPPPEALLDHWIDGNPPPCGAGWEPYPTSLRIVNWIKYGLAEHKLSESHLRSLRQQTEWLSRHLEYHLLGNHLWANAKALIFSGLFFDDPFSRRILEKGLVIMRHEIAEQILPDGGHFERSPMYHAIMTEDVLDLINLFAACSTSPLSDLHRTAQKMLDWLGVMTHPDDALAGFNDTAQDMAPRWRDLIDYADRLGLPPAATRTGGHLSDSGFARLHTPSLDLLADVGSVGPSYLPGHAHAETLSFELSAGGARCLINRGISTYEASPIRLEERSTSAHNTLVVDELNSSEVWSSFRVARRARVTRVTCGEQELQAAHDGYTRIRGVGVHQRTWRIEGDGTLVVEDHLQGNGVHDLDWFFHLHPEWDATASDGSTVRLTRAERALTVLFTEGCRISLEPSFYAPSFGLRLPSQMIHVSIRRPLPVRQVFRFDCT